MENVRDDFIVRSMESTGYPPWLQEPVPGFPDEEELKEPELPESCIDVLAHLQFGKDNAITRKALSIKTGLCDRQVRRSIEILRRDYVIINDQDGKGYYRPRDNADVMRYYRQEYSRALAVLRRLTPARHYLKVVGEL